MDDPRTDREILLSVEAELKALRENQQAFREQIMADMRKEADEKMHAQLRHAIRPSRRI